MIFCFDNQTAKLCKSMKFLILVAAIVACVHCVRTPPPLREFHRDLSPKDLNHYFGVQAKHDVPDYELVHLKKSKPRRSTTAEKEPLQYDFSAFGENYSLDLEHNDKLIAPGCLVHYFQANGTKKVRPCPVRNDDCYYYGTSSNHNDSNVAISTCSGVMGMVRLPDRDYDLWIQPVLKKHHNRARRSINSAEPHIVVKRSTPGPDGAPAAVSSLVSDIRRRRDADDRYAEMLLVADKTMHEAHGDDLRNFLLAVANVASRILADQSIGTPIHLSVVKINILEDDEPGLTIVEDVTETLQSFCSWQEKFNVKDDNNPQHYDGAALFTRLDIIFQGVKDTTGYATVAGMCGDKKRCSYNQDTGLNTGVTLAHETGHTLGMVHDGADNSCPDKTNMMSSGGMGGKTALFWSECSRKALHDFLATSAADCLKDVPQNVLALPKELPGVLYDGDEQCRMFAGEGSTICTGTTRIIQSGGDECERLFCFDPEYAGTCIGDSVPRMDGTMCGDRKYCMRGQCVDIGPDGPPAVDGGWSDFDQEWSPCSRSCGGGVRVKTRRCNNPKPRLGGKPCQGLKIMAELCNMQPCSISQEIYRNEQCALTDSDPYNGNLYHWVPISDTGSQQCELHCKADGRGSVVLRQLDRKNFYKDGTICSATNASFSRCVDGICLSFGCDGKSGSSYQFDTCGVCGGQGETCSKITGKYSQGEKEQYVTFVTIPEKATSIFITNTNPFTQMTIKIGNNRIFNKVGTMQDRPGRYSLDGVTVVYGLNPESIKIDGPLPLPIEAQVWRRFADSEFMNAGPVITYEYYVPSTSGPSEYVWQATNGVCSKKCGGGVYNRLITCTRKAGGAVVDDHFCNVNEKPSITGDACNNQACPPIWKVGRYSTCSKTCGGGSQTRQLRCVRDMDGTEEDVDASSCPADQRPADTRNCNEDVACPSVWSTGAWSACSLTCGKGVQTRTITCVKDATSNEPVSDSLCDASAKPNEQQSCVLAVCNPEITGDDCKDTTSCGKYEPAMCKDYAAFAKTSCMKTCVFCTPRAFWLVKTKAATVKAMVRPSAPAICEDKIAECPGYGSSVCTGTYEAWAKENCAKMCGFCTGGSEAAATTPAACEDKNTQCKDYGMSVCTGQYAEWAKLTCPKMCGFCSASNLGSTAPVTQQVTTPTTTTSTTTPTTTPPTTSTMTTTAMPTTAIPIPTTTTTASTTSTPPATTITAVVQASACQDKDNNCATYGASFCAQTEYAAFAKENCARHCKLCPDMAGQVVECKDAVDNCPLYGESVCSNADYAEWVQINCAKFCKMCGGADITTSTTTTTTTTTPSTTTTTAMGRSEECKDQLSNCNLYDPTVCTNPAYKEWARTNCAFFCKMCGDKDTTTPTATTTTTTPFVTTQQQVKSDCRDQTDVCSQYTSIICNDTRYTAWVQDNCARFCNLCQSDAATTTITMVRSEECKDQLSSCNQYDPTVFQLRQVLRPLRRRVQGAGQDCKDTLTNCAQYDQSYCKQEEYKPWALSNCARFCGLCDVTTTTGFAMTTTTAASSADCSDVLTNCAQYDASTCTSDIYRSWAESNCAKTCKLCSTATTSAAAPTATSAGDGCKDTFSNCAGYGSSICSDAQYTQWVAENCREYCGLCGGSAVGRSAGSGSGNGAGEDLNGNGNGIGNGNGNGNGSPASGSTVGDDACKDVFDNCPGYGPSMCTNYADWALQNCRKYCNKCAARRRRSVLMPPSPRSLCNTVLTARQGSLALIGHPLDMSCDHVIVAPIGSSVHLSFNDVLISCEEGDWLEVQEEGGSVKKGKSRHDLCNAGRPREWTTRGNVVTIRMSVATPGHGYNMTYSMLQAPPRPGCDRLLTNPTGILSSPGFPEEYPSNKLCVTTIVAPPGYSVRLSFSFLELESDDCSKDSVTLLDQDKGIKDVFCGVQANLLWESKSNKIKVFFASDNQNSAKGFLASYKFIGPW
ncbi:uncharacterized protein LOC112575657 [Pomacea canaliculata]|uniref:uncharacterized protein LOC112575657 n=1 Tax=Pomacea canaliculata TaxID=400727 RepID=UPI000D72D61A|nr:uncharacterized protein LOC112575657 [Pomacea canaliculata]